MAKRFGQLLMLFSALVLFCGTQATWCDVYQAVGLETHHHGDGMTHVGHHHHDEELPRDGDCVIEISEASLPKELPVLSAGEGIEAPTWQLVELLPARSVVSASEKPIPPPAPPPSATSPPVLGRFLI